MGSSSGYGLEYVRQVILDFSDAEFGFSLFTIHKKYRHFLHSEALQVRLLNRFNLDIIGLAVQEPNGLLQQARRVASVSAGAVVQL
jgi:hypothetical protein